MGNLVASHTALRAQPKEAWSFVLLLPHYLTWRRSDGNSKTIPSPLSSRASRSYKPCGKKRTSQMKRIKSQGCASNSSVGPVSLKPNSFQQPAAPFPFFPLGSSSRSSHVQQGGGRWLSKALQVTVPYAQPQQGTHARPQRLVHAWQMKKKTQLHHAAAILLPHSQATANQRTVCHLWDARREKKRIKPLFFYLFGFTSVALVRTLPTDVGFLCEGASRRCSVDCLPHNTTAQSWLWGAHTGQTEHFQLRQERAFGNKALLIGTAVLENIFVSVRVTEQGDRSPSMQ